MKYEFSEKDIFEFKLLLKRVYDLKSCDDVKDIQVIGYKGGSSWDKAETYFILSKGDSGYSHCLTFKINYF